MRGADRLRVYDAVDFKLRVAKYPRAGDLFKQLCGYSCRIDEWWLQLRHVLALRSVCREHGIGPKLPALGNSRLRQINVTSLRSPKRWRPDIDAQFAARMHDPTTNSTDHEGNISCR
jgi:hypothetical protein